MNFIAFSNSYIFPLILFFIITFSTFNLLAPVEKKKVEIDSFFEQIASNEELYSQLESLNQRGDFINKLLEMSKISGYLLTSSEIEKAILDTTSKSYNNYICLPIGCWKLS